MSTEIRTQESVEVPVYTEMATDFEARRWLWSASIKEDLSALACGHSVIHGRELLPLNTFTKGIPVEVPALLSDGGIESAADSPFHSRFITYHDPAGNGIRGAQHTGQVRTAAQLCHDILFSLNTVQSRGFGEIKAFRGKFNTGAEVKDLESLYRMLLPVEARDTLKKTIARLNAVDMQDVFGQSPHRKTMFEALPEFRTLAMEAELYISLFIGASETELEQSMRTGKGKKLLDDLDRYFLKELEQTERSLLSVTQGVSANAALGKELADGIISGLQMRQDSSGDLDTMKAQIAELLAYNKTLATKLVSQAETVKTK